MAESFGTAVEVNARYKRVLRSGATRLSVTFDLPTRLGYDSDAPVARGQVGRAGVAVDSLDDMRVLFGGIPLDTVSASMTVNAPAAVLLLLYQLVGEEQGIPGSRLTGVIRADVPPEPPTRLSADLLAYRRAEIPGFGPTYRDLVPPPPVRAAPRPRLLPRLCATGRKTRPAPAPPPYEQPPAADTEARQIERLAKARAWRCGGRVDDGLTALRKAAEGADNVLYPMKRALAAGATVGEAYGTLRDLWVPGTS